jgi:hypothetical protein
MLSSTTYIDKNNVLKFDPELVLIVRSITVLSTYCINLFQELYRHDVVGVVHD